MIMNEKTIGKIATGMAEMASIYSNDIIANNLARVSVKLESLFYPFAPKLDALDVKVVRFYLAQSAK